MVQRLDASLHAFNHTSSVFFRQRHALEGVHAELNGGQRCLQFVGHRPHEMAISLDADFVSSQATVEANQSQHQQTREDRAFPENHQDVAVRTGLRQQVGPPPELSEDVKPQNPKQPAASVHGLFVPFSAAPALREPRRNRHHVVDRTCKQVVLLVAIAPPNHRG